MSRIIRIGILSGLLLVGLMVMATQGSAILAQDQTVPTRTPTPGSASPTSPAPPSPTTDSGGGNNNPGATSTATSEPPGGATATATTQVGAAQTATATTDPLSLPVQLDTGSGKVILGPCGDPIIVVSELTLVHAGPGEDYPVVGSLQATEGRLIVGRAGFAPWWQILLISSEPQLIGWVAEDNHAIFGDTSLVPVVESPLLNGIVPTAGAPWQPTPASTNCQPTATATLIPTLTATPTATVTATIIAGSVITTPGAPGGIAVEGGSAAELESQGSNAGKQSQEGETVQATDAGTSAASSGSTDSGSGAASLLVPLLGLALIAGGVVIALLSRSRPPAA